MMRALTLTQPWATLVAYGEKRIETRGWQTKWRGQIAIHAAKAYPNDARCLAAKEPFVEALRAYYRTEGYRDCPRGEILAVATLRDVFTFGAETDEQIRARSNAGRLPRFEADFGDYAPGRFGFVLDDVRRLPKGVPARGMLNLWIVPSDVEAAVRAQLPTTSATVGA